MGVFVLSSLLLTKYVSILESKGELLLYEIRKTGYQIDLISGLWIYGLELGKIPDILKRPDIDFDIQPYPDIWPNIWPDIGYLDIFFADYQISGWILILKPTRYRISGPSLDNIRKDTVNEVRKLVYLAMRDPKVKNNFYTIMGDKRKSFINRDRKLVLTMVLT